MPKKEKETRTCHECGLEDWNACEDTTPSRHLPDNENLAPCRFCLRNPKRPQNRWTVNLYCETWTRSGDKDFTAEISDPDPHEQALLRTLHLIVNESVAQVVR